MADLSPEDISRIADAVADKMMGHSSADIAAAAAHKVVQELTIKGLALVGVDVADKRQIAALKEDLQFVRSMRNFSERTGRQVSAAITHAITWGFIVLLVLGFWVWSRGGHPPSGTASAAQITK